MAKNLIVYYSHTGNTKTVAEALAPKIGADIDSIRPLRLYKGRMPLKGILHVIRKNKPDIETERLDPAAYESAILMTPIWAGTIPPHVRTYLDRNRAKLGAMRLISLSGSSGDEAVIKTLKDGFGIEPRASLLLHNQEISDGSYKRKLDAFAAKI